MLRSVAEENNCDIVFINSSSLSADNPGLLAGEILKNKIVYCIACQQICEKLFKHIITIFTQEKIKISI